MRHNIKSSCKEKEVEKQHLLSLLCSQSYIEHCHMHDVNYKRRHIRRQFEHGRPCLMWLKSPVFTIFLPFLCTGALGFAGSPSQAWLSFPGGNIEELVQILDVFFLGNSGLGSICGYRRVTKPKWPMMLSQHMEDSTPETSEPAVDFECMEVDSCCVKSLRFWCRLLLQHNLHQAYRIIKFPALMEVFYVCIIQYGIHQPHMAIENLKCGQCD